MADGQLFVHVLLDEMHGHVPWSLDHHLTVVLPGNRGQLAQRFQFGKLRCVVGIGGRAGAQPIAEREADVIRRHDLADVAKMGIQKIFLVMRQAPLGEDRAAA